MEVNEMLEPLGAFSALKAVDELMQSARYDTPARPGRQRGRKVPNRVRRKTADALRRLANVIQPHTEPSPRQHTCSAIGA
jgi:hypothetical protein